MEPGIKEGDFVFIGPMSYLLSYPRKGDIVMVQHPTKKKKLLKRIVKQKTEKERDMFWIEGDNKEQSVDSRSFGWIPQNLILGKAKVIHKTLH